MILLAKLRATLDQQFIVKVEQSLSVPIIIKAHLLCNLTLNYLTDLITIIFKNVGYWRSVKVKIYILLALTLYLNAYDM